ncbi:MAG: diaminopimelate decarboxylase [Gemmatimonadaceae bacterium]
MCEDVAAEALASAIGTPAYVYSASAIRAAYERLASALSGADYRMHYSVKANSSLAVLALIRRLGAGVDIVSGGELYRALRTGFTGSDIVFSGVGKTATELLEAIAAGVALINVESVAELRLLNDVASMSGSARRVPVAIRVNPEVTVETPHAYTRTGERGHKFGIPYDDALDACRLAVSLPNIELSGLAMHIGSQISDLAPYRAGLARLVGLVHLLRSEGEWGALDDLKFLDVGGGLAVAYDDEPEPDIEEFARVVIEGVRPTGLRLLVEPGRFLVGNAGVLLTRVLYTKRSGGKDYVIVDAGMNDLLRPSHYHAYHRIGAAGTPRATPDGDRRAAVDAIAGAADIVGPVCESGDFLALDRAIGDVAAGDLLALYSVGAYGFVMASNYNARVRPVEVLVEDGRYAVIRRRESYDDLVRHETSTPEWQSA